MNLNDKKIIVVGGTGFIGKYLLDSLADDCADVYCFTRKENIPDKKNIKYINCDLRNIDPLLGGSTCKNIGKADWIIYLAASIPLLSDKKENLTCAMENNLGCFLHFLENFGDMSDKIIFTSSIDVYGIPKTPQFSESAEIKPLTNYAIAKYCQEKYLEYFCRLKSKQYVILRLSQVFGPNEPLVRVMSILINALLQDKEFTLTGSGTDKRRFLYVKDAVHAIKLAMNYSKSDVFNIAGSEDISVLETIKIVEKISNKKLKIKKVDVIRDKIDILPDFTKAKKDLAYGPKYTFQSGVEDILKYSSTLIK